MSCSQSSPILELWPKASKPMINSTLEQKNCYPCRDLPILANLEDVGAVEVVDEEGAEEEVEASVEDEEVVEDSAEGEEVDEDSAEDEEVAEDLAEDEVQDEVDVVEGGSKSNQISH